MSRAGRLHPASRRHRSPRSLALPEQTAGLRSGATGCRAPFPKAQLSATLTSKKAFSSTVLGAPMVGVPGVMDSTSARSMTPLHSVSIRLS